RTSRLSLQSLQTIPLISRCLINCILGSATPLRVARSIRGRLLLQSRWHVFQPDGILADFVSGDEAEGWAGAGEEWLAATEYEGAEVEMVFVDETKAGEVSRELGACDVDLAVHRFLQPPD